jgi:filamentous hemagglutinin
LIYDDEERGQCIAEWHRRGYDTPRGGCEHYDLHHVLPREYGGTHDFWNLVPVERITHRTQFDTFWQPFIGL